jgi:hypothetical protein
MPEPDDPAENTLYARAGNAFTPAQAGEPVYQPPNKNVDEPPGPDQRKPSTTIPEGVKAPAPGPTSEEQIADAQADQYLSMAKALDPLASGATGAGVATASASGAASLLGQSSSSPIGQWLQQNTQAAQAQYAPVAAAESSVSAAENQATSLEAGALKGLGTAESEQMQAAPYTSLLNSLAAEVPYEMTKSYVPAWASAPEWLKTAEAGAGVPGVSGQSTSGGTTASTGATPILAAPPVAANVTPSVTPGADQPAGGFQT